jgi:type I restriction enzyme, S subunit
MKTKKVKDLFRIYKGKKAFEDSSPETSKVRYIQIEDLRDDSNLKDCETNEKNVLCSEKDILIAWDGANAGTIGFGIKGAIGSTIAKLVPQTEINTRYIGLFLRSKSELLRQSCTGATIPHISKQFLDNIEIPLPPLDQQIRIATILDTADALRQKDKELLATYDELLKATFLDMFGDPKFENKYHKTTLKDISIRFSDGPFGSNLKTEHYSTEGIQVVRLQNIGVNEYLGDDAKFVGIQHYQNVLKKYTCFSGDIVIATLGSPNLRACIIPQHIEKAINKADCVLCRVNPNIVNNIYVSHLINQPGFLSMAQLFMHGQTRIRISSGQLANMLISIPPLNLQNQFAQIVTNIESQKSLVKQNLQQSEELFNALVQKAFNG